MEVKMGEITLFGEDLYRREGVPVSIRTGLDNENASGYHSFAGE